MPTLVFVATIGWLHAAQMPIPVDITAMVLVAFVLRWLVVRTDHRLANLERDVKEQRDLKHGLQGGIMGMHGTLILILDKAQSCTCGALTPVVPLMEPMMQRLVDLLAPEEP